jgi:hypothetical protein
MAARAGMAVAWGAAPVLVDAAEAADLAEPAALEAEARREASTEEMEAAPEEPAEAAAELKLARRDDRSPATDDWTEAAELVADESLLWRELTLASELAAEPAAEVREAKADEPPPTREERRLLTWPLTAPAARTVVARMVKRMLMVVG